MRTADPPYQLRYIAKFSQDDLRFARSRGYDTVRLADGDLLNEAGKPRLPVKTIRIALPVGMTVTGVRVPEAPSVTLPGKYTVYPGQPPRPLAGLRTPRGLLGPDPLVYAALDAYPGKLAEFVHQTDLAGQSVALVRLYPVQYAPGRRQLTLYPSITIQLEGITGYECGDYLPSRLSPHSRRAYEQRLRTMVVNPDDIALAPSPEAPPGPRGVGPGSYEYVIITPSAWVDDFQPLADWRIKTGIPTTIVTTDWIYTDGGYLGTNLEKVRAFVEDAHDNWGATYFLLGADTHMIPYHVRTITVPGYSTDDIPNDTYYADYDDDWVCEVHVARFSARDPMAIAIFVNKVFTYEKNPPLSDYVTTAAFFGFDITWVGDNDGEDAKERVRTMHLPVSWDLDTEYDSEPGTHREDVIAYLNEGHHLVNHHDHCHDYCMGTGWISHGDLIYTADVNALTNGDRQSILFAVGCNPADFTAYLSIGESFVQNPFGGGVAFMGNTRTGWGGDYEDPDHYSLLQDRLFFESLFNQGLYRLGECFSYLKNNAYEGPDPYNLGEYSFTQLHLLGEPVLPVWTEEPQGLTVTHDDTLPAGEPATFPVDVYSGGIPVDDVTVCLWKEGDLYEVAQTQSGTATVEFTPPTTGGIYVTVTGHNYLPYEGQATVCGNGDFDHDGNVDGDDRLQLITCFTGPGGGPVGPACASGDFDADGDIDCPDWNRFALSWTEPGSPTPPAECVAPPLAATYPHNRTRNRYLSFDPNKAMNDGLDTAFRVTLTSLLLASCAGAGSPDVEGWPCRTDDDCRACSVTNTPCIAATVDCEPMPPQTCDLTGAHCVNDQAGSVGQSWWVGPEHPTLGNDVHLLVSESFRKVSANWPAVVHLADCEVVPVATYAIRAVNVDTAAESDQLPVSTITRPDTWWADCVGPLGEFCTGNWASCTGDGDCPAGETCLEQWPPPDGFINFHEVNAAVFSFSQLPGLTITDPKNLDLHGNDAGEAQADPPNYVINFDDIANMISAFQDRPYPYNDPADCPSVGVWP